MILDLYRRYGPNLQAPPYAFIWVNRAVIRKGLKAKGLLHTVTRWGHSRLHCKTGFNHIQ